MPDRGAADPDGPHRGAAVRDAARPGASGRVVSVHRRAVYLLLDGMLIALVGEGVQPGPLHLRGGPLPPAVPGERVRCDGSRIAGRSWAVRCDVPDRRGALPARLPRRERGDAQRCAGQRPVEGPVPPEIPLGAGVLLPAVRAGEVEELARLLGGRGPGLTPAGDDLLAGLLLVARALWGPDAEPRLVAAAASVATTTPAVAFLHWAALGQSLAPAHDVLTAVADRDPAGTVRAARRLEAVGASSGRCLLAGLRLGLAQLPRLESHSARAGPEAAL